MGFKGLGLLLLVLLLLLHCSRGRAKGEEEEGDNGRVKKEGEGLSYYSMGMVHKSSRYPTLQREELLMEARKGDKARLAQFANRIKRSFPSAYPGRDPPPAPSPTSPSSPQKTYETGITSGEPAGAGQYFVEFFIGSPPQSFNLIADTGSDLVWVQCSDCKRTCAQDSASAAPTFIARDSSSYAPIPCLSSQCLLVPPPARFSCNFRIPSTCRYDYPYADTSESVGVFAMETVTLNSSSGRAAKVPNLAFGCGLRNSGQSFVGSSGVLGLGRGPISFPSQVAGTASVKFAYCLVDFFHNPTQRSLLLFGDLPPAIAAPSPAQLQLTPLLSNPFGQSFYYVRVVQVLVNGQALPIPSYVWDIDAVGNGGTVVDSGTTLSFFVEPAYTQILQAMSSAFPYPKLQPSQTFDLCFNASGLAAQDLLRLPQLEIVFRGDARFRPPPSNYFIEVTRDGLRCLGIQGVESPVGFSVLGNLIQQNYLVQFDSARMELGFVPTPCSQLQMRLL